VHEFFLRGFLGTPSLVGFLLGDGSNTVSLMNQLHFDLHLNSHCSLIVGSVIIDIVATFIIAAFKFF
jgi:hypothetical protein